MVWSSFLQTNQQKIFFFIISMFGSPKYFMFHGTNGREHALFMVNIWNIITNNSTGIIKADRLRPVWRFPYQCYYFSCGIVKKHSLQLFRAIHCWSFWEITCGTCNGSKGEKSFVLMKINLILDVKLGTVFSTEFQRGLDVVPSDA